MTVDPFSLLPETLVMRFRWTCGARLETRAPSPVGRAPARGSRCLSFTMGRAS